MNTLFFILQLIAVPALSPLLIGVIRKVKAVLQNRVGADVLQPYRDLWKLFQKDEVISSEASWVTRYFPIVIFSITVLIGAAVPLITSLPTEIALGEWIFTLAPVSDFIVIVYLFALSTFLLVLIGMDQGSAFGGFGSSREMMVSALAEGGLFFSLLTVSIAAQTGSVTEMVAGLGSLPLPVLLPLLIAFIGFFLVLLAENARFPFDNPATHLELTMIHEAMILDLSGKRLALLEWAAANKLMIFIALGANLFFPWGTVAELDLNRLLLVALPVFLAKATLFAIAIACIESLMAKFRLFRLPDVLFTSFILSVIAIGIYVGAYV
ncbi:MAG: NADH-quinone oxidoreductase subunit H [Candidatus Moranbacteria bacterium]|nr:NADH-quinone oxidoreductase subunit H [Candidatus Moranbacteria bacterium]MBP6033965.1 NADH-quinone oxidoreductase subunit H [Candidatus Moranbacteria bacterium]MBP7695576.1 NADH-quinone oxidoreductase subunit H [Candidatus Moranbacteria bacterium]